MNNFILIENRPGITENKLELLLKSLSDDWQGNPIFNSTRSSLSPSITSKNQIIKYDIHYFIG